MYNLPVKLSLLSQRQEAIPSRDFLDLAPPQALELFLRGFDPVKRETLLFGFSKPALLLVLAHELSVTDCHQGLVWEKSALDGESWRLANGLAPDTAPRTHVPATEDLVDTLFRLTCLNEISDPFLEERMRRRDEIETLVGLFSQQFGLPVLAQNAADWKTRFFHQVMAQAVFKADAASILLGMEHDYARAWIRTQQKYMSYALHAARSRVTLPGDERILA